MKYIKEYRQFEKKLESEQRSLRWFWFNYVTVNICSYPYLHGIVAGTYGRESDKVAVIDGIIKKYLESEK